MNRKKRIKEILTKKLTNFDIIINDNSSQHSGHNNFDGSNETHIELVLKKVNNNSINKLEIHRLINNILKEEFAKGLNSLEIKIN